ncbi:hypothetical protein BDZ94DRAFT_1212419 [Collybia nuda]|uniref:MYND-type domain-containing protein n=1 Tax=Collybia nuda TaxID=64659 RepID=A0A9P6CI22_9AGAR|nr:hypothetical protein BDZ94DRAFT_1212419 [Collybia nuda]
MEPIPKPDKTSCIKCGRAELPGQALQRCGKCRTAPYCSVECQKADWKLHKVVCVRYVMDKSMNYTGVYFGEKAPKAKKEIRRTRGDILQDLTTFANAHNGDTLTVSAWNLLELTRDISRARSHFLALTLRRTESSNPRTLYSLVQAEVIPWPVMDEVYANRGYLVDSSSASPRDLLDSDAQRRKGDGHGSLGSVMVLSVELPKGDDRSPIEAFHQLSVHMLHPLGLFKAHQSTISRLPRLPREFYIKCLENSLKGGAYTMRFQPHV